jgi:hypothetical protein
VNAFRKTGLYPGNRDILNYYELAEDITVQASTSSRVSKSFTAPVTRHLFLLYKYVHPKLKMLMHLSVDQ